jgi:hypothetical protein
MFVFARRRDHLLHGQVVGNGRHARTRFHHVLGGFAIQADDLQDDLLLRLCEGALLIRQVEKLLVFLIRQGGLRADEGFGNQQAKQPTVEPLHQPLEPASGLLQEQHRSRNPQSPAGRRTDGECFRQDFAAEEDEEQHGQERPDQGPFSQENRPKGEHDDAAVGDGVAQGNGGEELGRLFQQTHHECAAIRELFGQLLRAPFAQGKKRGFGESKKGTRCRAEQDSARNQVGCISHARGLFQKGG